MACSSAIGATPLLKGQMPHPFPTRPGMSEAEEPAVALIRANAPRIARGSESAANTDRCFAAMQRLQDCGSGVWNISWIDPERPLRSVKASWDSDEPGVAFVFVEGQSEEVTQRFERLYPGIPAGYNNVFLEHGGAAVLRYCAVTPV